MLALLVAFGASTVWWMDWPLTLAKENQIALNSCTDQPFNPTECTWNNNSSTGHILLAGDSQAYAAADGVVEAARLLGLSAVVSSRSGCPLSSLDTTSDKPLDCTSWQGQIIEYALSTKPRAVVIANRSTGYTNDGWRTMVSQDGTAANFTNAISLYESGLSEIVQTLRRVGIPVIILQNIPEPEQVDTPPSLLGRLLPPSTSSTLDASDTLTKRAPVALAERRIAMKSPGTLVVDPIDVLCQDAKCDLRSNGEDIFLDPWHLTREGSLLLSPTFYDAILKVTR